MAKMEYKLAKPTSKTPLYEIAFHLFFFFFFSSCLLQILGRLGLGREKGQGGLFLAPSVTPSVSSGPRVHQISGFPRTVLLQPRTINGTRLLREPWGGAEGANRPSWNPIHVAIEKAGTTLDSFSASFMVGFLFSLKGLT